jgi:protein-arginine kinase activator protein McsA
MFHHGIYISKCFNWKCNGVIDDRDTKKCPNGWNICSVCGSCCSNRIAEQRITHCTEIGIEPSRYFYEFLAHKLGHLEKKEFYCCKCGGLMNNIGDSVRLRMSDAVLLSLISDIPLYIEDNLMERQCFPFDERAQKIAIPINTMDLSRLQSALADAIENENYELASQLRDEINKRHHERD